MPSTDTVFPEPHVAGVVRERNSVTGDIVRISPRELVFSSPRAAKG